MSTNIEPAQAVSPPIPERDLFATMALIRAFETRVAELYRDGEIPGFVHTSLGQEAVAAGRRRARSRTTTTSPPPTAATATASPTGWRSTR